MLVEELKKRITAAVKDGDSTARDVLRLALGEIQTAEARKNGPLADDEAANALRKLVKSNEETLALSADGERAATLRREIEVLSSLLPKQLSADAIAELLAAAPADVVDAIKAAKNDGQATGAAMKHLKTTGASVTGAEVTLAVKKLRGT